MSTSRSFLIHGDELNSARAVRKMDEAGSRGSTLVLLMPTSVVFKHSETAVKRLNSLPFTTVSLETGPNPSSSTAHAVQPADLGRRQIIELK